MGNTHTILISLADATGNTTQILFNPAWASIAGIEAPNNTGARYIEPHVDDYIPWYARPRGELHPTVPGGYIPYWLKPPIGHAPLAAPQAETRYIEPHVDDYIPWYAKPRQIPLIAISRHSPSRHVAWLLLI